MNNHKGYRVTTGIISIVLGAIMAFATIVLLVAGDMATDLEIILVGISTLFLLPSGILHLAAKNSKKLLVIAGIVLLIGAGVNVVVINLLNIVK